MTKRQGAITAGELMAQLMADPEWAARKQERDRISAERTAWLRKKEEPILADLRALGYNLELVSDFMNSPNYYESAIPVLLKHLIITTYPDCVRETIARSLAMPQAQHLWPILADEYRKAPVSKEQRGYKDGLAVALSATVTDATINDLISLAKDKTHGESRLLLLRAIKKSRTTAARNAIKELALDPQLEKEIASWKRKSPQSPQF